MEVYCKKCGASQKVNDSKNNYSYSDFAYELFFGADGWQVNELNGFDNLCPICYGF